MSKTFKAASLAAAAIASAAISVQPANAAKWGDERVVRVAYRGCYAGESPASCRDRMRWENRSHRHLVWRDGRYYDDNNSGSAIVGGILGFALGAAIAGSHDDYTYYQSHRNDRGWRARCRNLPGFDWRSGTYIGRDGYRHYCVR